MTDHFTSKYIDLPWTPLYPFGYGLSYTKFKYANLKVIPDPEMKDQFLVSFDLSNTGDREGSEVAEVYINQMNTSVTRPVEQLAGFKRVELSPGQTKKVEFTLTPSDISFIDERLQRVVESGDLKIMVGGNSADLISAVVHIEKFETLTQ